MKMILEGDFGVLDCDKCYRRFRVSIKDEKLNSYFCPYCGTQNSISNTKLSDLQDKLQALCQQKRKAQIEVDSIDSYINYAKGEIAKLSNEPK